MRNVYLVCTWHRFAIYTVHQAQEWKSTDAIPKVSTGWKRFDLLYEFKLLFDVLLSAHLLITPTVSFPFVTEITLPHSLLLSNGPSTARRIACLSRIPKDMSACQCCLLFYTVVHWYNLPATTCYTFQSTVLLRVGFCVIFLYFWMKFELVHSSVNHYYFHSNTLDSLVLSNISIVFILWFPSPLGRRGVCCVSCRGSYMEKYIIHFFII